jgi:glucose/arabinose dehydrogenase
VAARGAAAQRARQIGAAPRRGRRLVAVLKALAALCALAAALAALGVAPAAAAPPLVAEIEEPGEGAAPLNAADVHMVARFEDADGDGHLCSDWEIHRAGEGGPAWQALCVTEQKVHVHLGDGSFVGSHAGRTTLLPGAEYVLRVRFRDDSGAPDEWGEWRERPFETAPAGAGGQASALPWAPRPGYAVEVFASGLRLPVGVAMVPEPGPHPGDPLLYVAELYGTVKVVTRDGSVRDYATGLLDFDPTGNFPGSGEKGVAGIVVEPASGDVLVSLVYQDPASPAEPRHYPRVIRLHSDGDGLAALSQTTVIDMAGELQGASHQVSDLTIAPDGTLYVHNGDGSLEPEVAQDLGSFRGKVLRMGLEGEPHPENPFYDEGDGVSARDYVYAYGLRNPFGGALRLGDGAYLMVENGPFVDRLAPLLPGENYQWPVDKTMSHLAAYRWIPSHAPVGIEFVEPQRLGGSGFPAATMGHAFVTESGPTYASGPQANGKRIVELEVGAAGNLLSGPTTLVEYDGIGKATAAGLAAGPDGLYFTDLYEDSGAGSPADRGANLLRVYHCGSNCPRRPGKGDEPPPPPPRGDTDPPRVSRFRLLRSAFAVPGRLRGGAERSGAARGTAFLFELSEPATVSIRIARLGARRALASLRAPGKVGPNRRPFRGRPGTGPLAPGRYTASLEARDGNGNGSSTAPIRFRVVAR